MIEVYNPNPWMTFGGMGSKRLVGENIEYIANNDSHPGAQFNSQFHELVKSEIAKFVTRDRRETARAETPRRVRAAQVLRSSKVASVEKATHRQGELDLQRPKQNCARRRTEVAGADKDVEHVADERRTQQLIASTEFIDKISSSVDAGDLLRSAATNCWRFEGLCEKNLLSFAVDRFDGISLWSSEGEQIIPHLTGFQRSARTVSVYTGLDETRLSESASRSLCPSQASKSAKNCSDAQSPAYSAVLVEETSVRTPACERVYCVVASETAEATPPARRSWLVQIVEAPGAGAAFALYSA